MKELILAEAECLDPFINQAMEAALMDYDQAFVVYLWRNDNTVVVGKNQNAYAECNINALEKSGGKLARRISGGGAVYHDRGNLNFTFISPRTDYDKGKQFDIMIKALESLGISAELSGRNDITAEGKKFSGNAFYLNDKIGLHHGTLLVDGNYESIKAYLSVSKAKLEAKGVKSVASRVINLTEIRSDLTVEMLKTAIYEQAERTFKFLPVSRLKLKDLNEDCFNKWRDFFRGDSWRYGDDVTYTIKLERRFDWGTADVRLKLNGNIIERARIYSDALDISLVEEKERALIGVDINNYNGLLNDIVGAITEEICTT